MNAEELVIAYAEHTEIIRQCREAIKAEMRKLSEDEPFCENPISQYESAPEESCIRRHLIGYIDPEEMCESCKVIWPYVLRKFNAKKDRSKIMQKINALGKRLKRGGKG